MATYKQYSIGGHAVVIGGSMAGLLAARVLRDYFDRVTVIERDVASGGPEPRKGVPQARHIHILLAQGYRILTRLFPGLDVELAEAGAELITWTQDAALSLPGGWAPRFDSDLQSYVCSRDLLDWLVRRRLLADGRIHFIHGQQVAGLLATADNRRVTGVRLRLSGAAVEHSPYQKDLTADLVVDASGRGSHLPDWLANLGYAPPEETMINASLGYASRWYKLPVEAQMAWKAAVIGARPPHLTRGGGMLPAENGRWLVTLAGTAGDYPPTDEAGFLAFARTLPDPAVYNAIQHATPLSPISGYRRTENRWRHYEKLPTQPEGVVALGDAVCAFNPVYGQGMTASALGALTLQECLAQERLNSALVGFSRRFQKELVKVVYPIWLMATGEDFRWPTTEGKRSWSMKLTHRYLEEVLALIPTNLPLSRAFFEVTHLVKPATSLFHPVFLKLVLPRLLKRKGVEGEKTAEKPLLSSPL